jgi:surface antigen
MFKYRTQILIMMLFCLTGCATATLEGVSNSDTPPTAIDADTAIPPSPNGDTEQTLKSYDVSQVDVANPAIDSRIFNTMDENDKFAASRALDKGLGTTTEWTNKRSGITYKITPLKKIIIKDNPYCREYAAALTNNAMTTSAAGTTCIGENGNWHTI